MPNALFAIDRGLRRIAATDATLKAEVERILKLLESIEGAQAGDLLAVREVLAGTETLDALRRTDDMRDAISALDAVAAWDGLVKTDATDNERQIFFSKEANNEEFKSTIKKVDAKPDQTMVFQGAGGNAVSGAEIALRNSNQLKVVLVARSQPAGLFENSQFRAMAKKYGDASVEPGLKAIGETYDPNSSEQRLRLIIDGNLDFTTPTIANAPDGRQRVTLQTRDGTGGRPVIDRSTNKRVEGDVFVTAHGSAGQLPPEIASLALAARRDVPGGDALPPEQRPVSIYADFTRDGRYLGYTVQIRIRGKSHRFAVRGAATRFVPAAEFRLMGEEGAADLKRIAAASPADAPSSGGNFDAGLSSTATQTSFDGDTHHE